MELLIIQVLEDTTTPLKTQSSRFVSLNHNIYIAADPTPVDLDHAAHAGGPTMCIPSEFWRHTYFKLRIVDVSVILSVL